MGKMKNYNEMTYDEQRKLLGLWQPDFTARWTIAMRGFAMALQSVIDAFTSLARETVRQDFCLAGEK